MLIYKYLRGTGSNVVGMMIRPAKLNHEISLFHQDYPMDIPLKSPLGSPVDNLVWGTQCQRVP